MTKENKQRWVIAVVAVAFGLTIGVIGAIRSITERYFLKRKPEMEVYPLDKAAKIMADYVGHATLGGLAKNDGFGGEFPATLFANALSCLDDSCGISLWFCKDSNGVFLALDTTLVKYSYKNMHLTPAASILYRPSTIFRYSGNDNDFETVRTYLRDDNRPTAQKWPITNKEVNVAISAFKESKYGEFNDFDFSFVADDSTHCLTDFLRKAGSKGYVRYYFAFEEKSSSKPVREMPNKIRIIFVATDSAGDNLITTTKKSMDDPILQSSWPPPPY